MSDHIFINHDVPYVFKDTLLNFLNLHIGKENAIGRFNIVKYLAANHLPAHERMVRDCIKQLRREGYLICSVSGEGGGYYMASSYSEFEEFDRFEFGAKISDMNETRKAMLASAKDRFGDAVQINLF